MDRSLEQSAQGSEMPNLAEKASTRDRWIAVYIAAISVVLAICALGGENAAKEAHSKNIEAANTWAWFQAKNMRRDALRLQIAELELLLVTHPEFDENARMAIAEKIATYRQQEEQLTSEPSTGEGLNELFARGKALEAERDRARSQDPYFDNGQALLQIAIVLASVAIVSGGNLALILSGGLGLAGIALTVHGFHLGSPEAFEAGKQLLSEVISKIVQLTNQ